MIMKNKIPCPKELVGAMPHERKECDKWLRQYIANRGPKLRDYLRKAAEEANAREHAAGVHRSKTTMLGCLKSALVATWPEIEQLSPMEKVLNAHDRDNLISHHDGDSMNEAIMFKGRGIVWTDGHTVKPVSLKWAALWYARMETKWAKDAHNTDGNLEALSRFLTMIAKALPA